MTGKRRLLVAGVASGLALVALSVLGYGAKRNGEARASVRASCEAQRAALPAVLDQGKLRAILGDDAGVVADDMKRMLDEDCAFLDARFVWWRWNLGATVALPPHEDER